MTTTDTEALRDELRALLSERALRFGTFTLRSGRTSDFYCDGKQVTLDGRGAYVVSRLVVDRCRELGVVAVGGLTLGADPIAAGAAAISGGDGGTPLRAFIVRKEVKDHGTAAAVEGPPLHPGDRVVVVDDTVTTGGALLQAVERVRATGAEVVEALCVLDREEGGAAAIEAAGLSLHALVRRSEFSRPAD